MTVEEMRGILGEMITVNQQLQSKQVEHDEWFSEMRTGLAETRALTESNARLIESNARSIEASTNESNERHKRVESQIVELARIVGQFAEATNSRLAILEDRG